MDSTNQNYLEKWNAMRKEYDAKAERLTAEERIKYNSVFDNFKGEMSAVADWTEAAWNEFTAKVEKKWQEFAIKMNDK